MTEKQEKFVRLIARGVSNTEACRAVGVARSTGIYWRFGRTLHNTAGEAVHYPPVHRLAPPKQRHPRYLSLAERTAIADLRREDKTVRQKGDCIMGAANQSAIGTLVERRTRYLILIGVFHGKPTAEVMRDAITTTFQALPARLRRTLTWDQGKELALHQQITERTGTRVFFCDAHSPWQRGSNENMNGLLRDYFPKGTDLRGLTHVERQRVAEEVNTRPRKSLDWARPADFIALEKAAAST
jgi:IS30 family transposase